MATQQVIMGGCLGGVVLSAIATKYFVLMGTSGGTAADSGQLGVFQVVPTAGSFSNLRINLKTAPGAGKSHTFTLRKNGEDTALTCTISDTSNTGNASTDVSISDDNLLCTKIVASTLARGCSPLISYLGYIAPTGGNWFLLQVKNELQGIRGLNG